MDSGGDPLPPLPPELDASCGKRKGGPNLQIFVKKADIPSIEMPSQRTCRTSLNIVDRGLIGKFSGLWPSPKAIDGWVERN